MLVKATFLHFDNKTILFDLRVHSFLIVLVFLKWANPVPFFGYFQSLTTK